MARKASGAIAVSRSEPSSSRRARWRASSRRPRYSRTKADAPDANARCSGSGSSAAMSTTTLRMGSTGASQRTTQVSAHDCSSNGTARGAATVAEKNGGLALMSGLRRGELFALRWRDFDEERQCLTEREAVYDGKFTPKTAAGVRQIPLSEAAVQLTMEWRARVKDTEPESLMFATWSGKPISPNNIVRRWIVPACGTLRLKRVTWLTLRRTYSSWAHEKGVPGKVIAQLRTHERRHDVATSRRRRAARAERGPEIESQNRERTSNKDRTVLARRTGRFPQLAHPRGCVNRVLFSQIMAPSLRELEPSEFPDGTASTTAGDVPQAATRTLNSLIDTISGHW